MGSFKRTISKTRATFKRRKPAGEPEEDLVKAAGRNSEKVLDRIGRLLVLLTLSEAQVCLTNQGSLKAISGECIAGYSKESFSDAGDPDPNLRCFEDLPI